MKKTIMKEDKNMYIRIKKQKKKLVIILVACLFFTACQKEKKFIEVEMGVIVSDYSGSFFYYNVINNSDFDISASIKFNIDGEVIITDCKAYEANTTIGNVCLYESEIDVIDYKVKICEI